MYRIFSIVLVLLSLSASAMAGADLEFWMQGSAGHNGYSLDDVNDEIRMLNEQSGLKGEELTKGFGAQGEVGLRLARTFMLGLGLKRMTGSTTVSANWGSMEYNLPCNATYGIAGVTLPLSPKLSFGVMGSFGTVSTDGKITITEVDYGSGSFELDGSGTYLEAKVSLLFEFSPHFCLAPTVGYRSAEIDEVKIGEFVLRKDDGSNYMLDYSGITAHVGIAVFIGK